MLENRRNNGGISREALNKSAAALSGFIQSFLRFILESDKKV